MSITEGLSQIAADGIDFLHGSHGGRGIFCNDFIDPFIDCSQIIFHIHFIQKFGFA